MNARRKVRPLVAGADSIVTWTCRPGRDEQVVHVRALAEYTQPQSRDAT